MNNHLLPCTDIEAYRTWRDRRVGSAYFLGRPGWVWQTALKRTCRERAA
jgi:hypothetical protein